MNISIVTCTYNPNKTLFERLISAVAKLEIPLETEVEWLIIDNNSDVSLKTIDYIINGIQQIKFKVSIIKETTQGLTAGRLRGYNESKGSILVLFDDDNEPESHYLVNAIQLIKEYQFVGVWGPGDISVDFLEKVPIKYENHFRGTFQEKHLIFTEYAYTKQFTTAHPFGTGMTFRKEALKTYFQKCQNRELKTTDRIGNTLLSSGDTQMVEMAIRDGWAVGSSPLLSMKHIIPKSRANYKYIERLGYSIGISTVVSNAELFPDNLININPPNYKYFTYKSVSIYMYYICSLKKHFANLYLAMFIGKTIGEYQVKYNKVPKWILTLSKMLGY